MHESMGMGAEEGTRAAVGTRSELSVTFQVAGATHQAPKNRTHERCDVTPSILGGHEGLASLEMTGRLLVMLVAAEAVRWR